MRHEQFLLSDMESEQLIRAVQSYLRKTKTNYNRLVTAAGVNPSVRTDVKKRGKRLTMKTAEKLRAAMRQNPNGIPKEQHKQTVIRRTRERLTRVKRKTQQAYPAQLVRVDRTPCFKCGIRKDIGCEHFPKAVNDG